MLNITTYWGKIMKKLIMVFFILTLLSLNSIWAGENGTVPPLIDITPEEVLVYDMPGDSGNVATVEQQAVHRKTLYKKIRQHKIIMQQWKNNAKSINSTQSVGNTQSTNNTSDNASVATPMQNTANPLIVMLLACILIPRGFTEKENK